MAGTPRARTATPLRRLALVLAVASGALDAGASARAEAGEWGLTLGPALAGFGEAPTEGTSSELDLYWGLAGRARYGLDDFWQLGAALDLGVASDRSVAGSVLVELHYTIDALTWVPYVSLGLGPQWRAAATPDLALSFGAGIDYRPARAYALGLSGRYMALVTDLERSNGAFQTALGLTLFFE